MRPAYAFCLGMILAAGASWAYTQQPQRLPMLSPQDYLEIQNFYYMYSRDVDPGSERDASWMFTEDGTFVTEGTRVVGATDLKQFYERVRRGQDAGVRHFTSNLVIVPSSEGARASSYMMTVERRESGGPAILAGFGMYHDVLVRTPAGWRFQHREFRRDTYRTTPTR
jgi:hypothetical protein